MQIFFGRAADIFVFFPNTDSVLLCCRGVAVSEQHGSPRVEGDPLQVGLHAGDGQPALLLLQVGYSTAQYSTVQYSTVRYSTLLLLQPLRDDGHGLDLRHRHRRALPHRQPGHRLRGVQGEERDIVSSLVYSHVALIATQFHL